LEKQLVAIFFSLASPLKKGFPLLSGLANHNHMEQIQLQFFLKIIGLGSASGLLVHNNTILAVGDSSSYLYAYHIDKQELQKHPMLYLATENIPKKQKPDFEAITKFQETIYVFGSGSTKNRNTMVQIDAKTNKVIATNDMTNLYATMQSFGEIKPDDFNLEGAIYNGDNWFLINRGNGKKSKNTIFSISGNNLIDDFTMVVNDFKLQKIGGVETSFTDAIQIGTKIYFLATAEDTNSTYDDGEILGSIIGRIDIETMDIDFSHKISDKLKLEGLAIFSETQKDITFLICEDNDTELLESNIYKLTLLK
jgi:hypothetical protein